MKHNMAKTATIENLMRQRNLISATLASGKKDGDPTYRYVGTLFPKNREFFEAEGFTITTFKSSNYKFEGLDVNVFTPREENMVLTEEEEAEALAKDDEPPKDYEDYLIRSFANLFGVDEDDDDDDEDECDDEEEESDEDDEDYDSDDDDQVCHGYDCSSCPLSDSCDDAPDADDYGAGEDCEDDSLCDGDCDKCTFRP